MWTYMTWLIIAVVIHNLLQFWDYSLEKNKTKQNKTKQNKTKKTDLDGIITHQRYSALPAELLSLQKADHILSSYDTRGGWRIQMNTWKIIYLNCGEEYEDMIDHLSYTHNLSIEYFLVFNFTTA